MRAAGRFRRSSRSGNDEQARRGPDGEDSEAPGVDLTLIDEMLRMTVRQRLEQNDRMAALAVELRAAFVGLKAA